MNKKEKDKLMEIMNKIQNKDKIINAISSKVNKQIFFILQIKQMMQRHKDNNYKT